MAVERLRRAATGGSVVLVARADAAVDGICTTYLDLDSVRFGSRAWVENLAVDPARSLGIGKRLLDAAKDWARERGATHLELDSAHARTDAQRFYEREDPSWKLDQLRLGVVSAIAATASRRVTWGARTSCADLFGGCGGFYVECAGFLILCAGFFVGCAGFFVGCAGFFVGCADVCAGSSSCWSLDARHARSSRSWSDPRACLPHVRLG